MSRWTKRRPQSPGGIPAQRSDKPTPSHGRENRDPRIGALINVLTTSGPPQTPDEDQLYERRTGKLLELIVLHHRMNSGGWLLAVSFQEIVTHLLIFMAVWYESQTSPVGLAEQLPAIESWLRRCAERGFPEAPKYN